MGVGGCSPGDWPAGSLKKKCVKQLMPNLTLQGRRIYLMLAPILLHSAKVYRAAGLLGQSAQLFAEFHTSGTQFDRFLL